MTDKELDFFCTSELPEGYLGQVLKGMYELSQGSMARFISELSDISLREIGDKLGRGGDAEKLRLEAAKWVFASDLYQNLAQRTLELVNIMDKDVDEETEE